MSTDNIYDQCPDSNEQNSARGGYSLSELLDAKHGEPTKTWQSSGLADDLHPHPALNAKLGGALNDWICGGEDAMGAWLNHPQVQAALHVSGHANNDMRYHSTVDDLASGRSTPRERDGHNLADFVAD